MINKFRGNYRWLSNMFETPVILHGVKYISVEHAYQSAKSIDEEWKKTCASDQYSSGEIKKLSKSVKIRHDWSEIKNKIMWHLLKQKFKKDPIKSWLLETGDKQIVEGNLHHDNHFGNCTCDKCYDIKGRNLLGKMIMRIRDDLRYEGKTIIAGSRDITDYSLVLEAIKKSGFKITEVVSGKAKGVDSLGEQYAKEHNIKIKDFPADWDKFKKAAGHIRNKQMGDYADSLIAITNGSKGTQNMIDYATSKGLRIYVYRVD